MNQPTTFNCSGTIMLRTGCGFCPACVDESKQLVNKFKRMPLNKIDKKTVHAVERSFEIIKREFGPRGFMKFIKTGR